MIGLAERMVGLVCGTCYMTSGYDDWTSCACDRTGGACDRHGSAHVSASRV